MRTVRIFPLPPGIAEPGPLKMVRKLLGFPEVLVEVPERIIIKPKGLDTETGIPPKLTIRSELEDGNPDR
jgi:hypothetical protein